MRRTRRPLGLLPALALTVTALAGCGGEEAPVDPDRVVLAPAEGEGHTHAPGQGHGEVVGDGTTPTAGGYQMTDVTLPGYSGSPGDVTFRILDEAGEPVRDFTEEQTKQLHLYVVREDLQDFRHLHPTLADDGTWSARVNLAGSGDYRVIAEFAPAEDPAGNSIVLAGTATVPGAWTPEPVQVAASTNDDGVVAVAGEESVQTGPDGRMEIMVSDVDGLAPTLGTYLGAYAHVTGFDTETGRFAHVHPFGEPESTEDGQKLTFHTEFDQPGDYVLFVQVRVDGFLHTVPVRTAIT